MAWRADGTHVAQMAVVIPYDSGRNPGRANSEAVPDKPTHSQSYKLTLKT